jgi:hypothetical protein
VEGEMNLSVVKEGEWVEQRVWLYSVLVVTDGSYSEKVAM